MIEAGEPVVVHHAVDGDILGYATEPRVTRLANGELLLSHRVATGRMSEDGEVRFKRTRDGGLTWEEVPTVGSPWRPQEASPIIGLPTGGVVATISSLDRSSGRLWFNPETEGRLPLSLDSSRSTDDGRTWEPIRPLDVSPYKQPLAQSLCLLPNGELLATFETFKEYDDPSPWHYVAGVIRSDDEGRSWHAPVAAAEPVDDGPAAGIHPWDPRLALLDDGELVQTYRGYHHDSGTDFGVFIGWSDDGGRSWSPPVPTGLDGQTSWPIALSDGRLLLFIQRRPLGFVIALSADGGRTWSQESEAVIYRHPEPSPGPADSSQSAAAYFHDMERFPFGNPCGIATGGDTAVVFFYAGARTRTKILAVPVRVDSSR